MASAFYYAKLVYNANGGSGAPAAQSASTSTPGGTVSITLRSGTPTRTYYTFKGWAFSSGATSGMSAGTTLSLAASETGLAANARVYTVYAAWQRNTVTIGYDPNGGSGSAWYQTVNAGEQITLSSTVPTRSGYTFLGWGTSSTATAAAYQPGGKATFTRETRLYAVWEVSNSTISSISGSVPIDGSTQGSVSISSINSSYKHELTISIGEASQVINMAAGVTSATFTIPASWLAEVPNSTTGTAVASLKTFNGSTQVGGADTKTFSITVPSSIVPTLNVAAANVNSNSVVDGWDILLQNYSQIKLTATAVAGTGATIANIAFSGDGISQTGPDAEATSAVLTSSGSRSWTVTATDSRGRTASTTVTETVHEYFSPSIEALDAFRSDSNWNRDDAAGTYVKATGVFSFASADGNNSLTVDQFEYQAEDASTWTVGQTGVVSGTAYLFGGGNITETKVFHIRLSLTDVLGNSAQYVVDISPIVGYAFGLKNDRVHFGGPCKEKGFVCDFATKLNMGSVVESHKANGTYAKVVTFEQLDANVTAPITMEFIRKSDNNPVRIAIRFSSSFGLDSFTKNASTDAYLYKSSSTIWELYVGKNNNSDSVEVLDFHNPWSNTGLTVEWGDTSISTLPTGYVSASPVNTVITESPNGVSLANNSWTTTASITLTRGIWILSGYVQFDAKTSGIRSTVLSASQNDGTTVRGMSSDLNNATSAGAAKLHFVDVYQISSDTTYYLNAYQNSGSAITTYGRITAIKII